MHFSVPLLIVLLVAVTLALVGWHLYMYRRLVRDTTTSNRLRKAGLALFMALAVLIPVTSVLSRQAATQSWRALYYLGFGWLGLGMLITVVLLAIDAGKLVHRVARKKVRDGQPENPARRKLIGKTGALAALMLGLGEATAGVRSAFGPWTIEAWRVRLRNFPRKLAGLRLVQISDVHVGATRGEDFLGSLVARVNALNPDLVVITGDLVDGSVPNLRHKVQALRDLHPRHGVFFVTGNHEYYSGAQEWIVYLRHLGLHVLSNEHHVIGGPDGSFDMVGVNDWTAKRFNPHEAHNLPKAMKGTTKDRVQVLLAHQPVSAWQASELNVDLQLSGHTHGGQIFPWNMLVRLQQPFVKGMHRLAETLVYVNRGAGFWGPPMRVLAPPEISLFVLDRATGTRASYAHLPAHEV